MTSLRLTPLPLSRIPSSFREALPQAPDAGIGNANLIGTLAHHPDLAVASNPLGLYLLFSGRLPPRDRELAILRTAVLTRCDYAWGHHARIGRRIGLTSAEAERVVDGPEHPAWPVSDAAVLRATDELHRGHSVSDETWQALAGRYSERQLIQLLFVVGHYHTFAYVMNSVRLPLEPDHAGIPVKPEVS